MQNPRWVLPSREARRAILDARERLRGLIIAVELRQGAWFNERNVEQTHRFLTDNAIAYVIVDEPQDFENSVPPVAVVTAPELAVFRFHGRRAETSEKEGVPPSERFRYLYDQDELAECAPTILDAARQTRETHVIMTNCYRNYCTANAEEMAWLLRELHEGEGVNQRS